MQLGDVKGKRVLVLGLGLHGGGVAVARWLVRHGARVTVSDLKSRRELASSLKQLKGLPVRYVLGAHPASLLKACDIIIQNPGVPRGLALLRRAKQQGIMVENEASLFLKLCPSRLVVGVTGSRGKSTTVSLLGAMLKRWNAHTRVAGNIRDTVMFDVLDKLTPATPLVLELSSWHLELVGQHRLKLPFGVVTNVLPDHLNRYSSFSAYARAKAALLRYQTNEDAIVLNHDNPITRQFGRKAPGQVYWFSLRTPVVRGAYRQGQVIYWRSHRRERMFKVSDVALKGEHNLANVLAATAAARVMGVPTAHIRHAVRTFRGLHDRLELVGVARGVEYYNDTTATSPEATRAALRTFAGRRVVLIAGGTDKNLPYADLSADIRRSVKALVLLPGSATVKLQQGLRGFQSVFLEKNMFQAVKRAQQLAPEGALVLLSPGAASFGLFTHEFDRGEQFKRAVNSLLKRTRRRI